MDRFWFLTNTCYGTWLPGDPRGFVGRVREHRRGDSKDQPRVVHNIPGTDYDCQMTGLRAAAASLLKGPPIEFSMAHAEVLLTQFQETAGHRHWQLFAVAIMFNHFHVVVGVPGDPNPSKILGDLKAWGTRALSDRFGAPASERWWTESGSKRKLKGENDVLGASHYVLYEQPDPLLTWSPESGLCYGIPARAGNTLG
jgi:REP element-mobilizing transposase RayT